MFLTIDKVHIFEREKHKQLHVFAGYESFFIFDGEDYTQIDGVAMVSPLCLTLSNAFSCLFEKKGLSECSTEFLPNVYKGYVDEMFVNFDSY